MAAFDLVAFGEEHLGSAADLLAARHRRDRAADARLSAAFEDAAACRPRIEAALARGVGVAALRDGKLAGYLISQTAALHEPHRRAFVPLEGHAVEAGGGADTYRQMYAVLSPKLIRLGLFDHQVHVMAADTTASDAWFTLTFGQGFHVASRSLDAIAGEGATVQSRLAGPNDAPEVKRLLWGLFRQGAESPSFLPYLFDEEAARLDLVADLDKPGAAFWLAYEGDSPVGVMYVGRPDEPGIGGPPDSAHIFEAFVDAEARARGIGTTLLRHCVAWARENGFARLSLDYRSYNIVGSRFWRGHGFRPVSTILQRRLDPRIAWANGSNE
jgi:ribosomal protein S18 acetylase RimI-like enzyme